MLPRPELHTFHRESSFDVLSSGRYADSSLLQRKHLCEPLQLSGTTDRQLHPVEMGVELLGDASVDGDGEIIAMTVELLKAAGLKEFQISIGQVDFFKALVDDSGMSEETIQELRQLISNKNYFGVEELLESQRLSKEQVEALTELPQLFGGPEVLKKAESLTGNPKALAAIRRLRELYQVASCYGCEEYISFDLGMLSKYQYYTGIIFQGFTYSTG